MKFIDLPKGTSGETIATAIESELKSLGLDLGKCRGQGYDGAGNMSGRYLGTSSLKQAEFPKALYVHCASHRLNLCVANACSIPSIRDTFGFMKAVHHFFNWPKGLSLLERKIAEICSASKRHTLIDVCRRWIARIEALQVFENLYPAIMLVLKALDDNEDGTWKGETCIEVKGLYSACTSFEFIMSLVLAQNGLSYVEPATRKLQATKMEVVKAYSEIGLLKSTVETKRAQIEDAHKNWYKKAAELAGKVGTEPTTPRISPRQTLRANAPAATPEEYYRINYSVTFLDHMIAQLGQHFSTDKIEILQSGFFLVSKCMNDALTDSYDSSTRTAL